MKKDSAVSNVVGEMLLLAIALVLVAVFATAAFSFLPGDRIDVADVAVNVSENPDDDTLYYISFWHKGGDWIDDDDLQYTVYNGTDKSKTRETAFVNLTNAYGQKFNVFDLGCRLVISAKDLQAGDEISLYTPRSVVYSGIYSGVVK